MQRGDGNKRTYERAPGWGTKNDWLAGRVPETWIGPVNDGWRANDELSFADSIFLLQCSVQSLEKKR